MKQIHRQQVNLRSSRGDSGEPAEEPPPVLGTWKRIYALVLGLLLLWILLLMMVDRVFR